MLAALEDGVKGGVWFSLIDKVYAQNNLWPAWCKIAANQGAAGVDDITIPQYEREVEANLSRVAEQLKLGQYQPKPIRRTYIPKADGKMRPLGIPTVQDRIVQNAIRQVIEPIFEKHFAPHSYGFRPGRGCRDALRRVQQLLDEGYRYVVDVDLKSYFDTIPHERLMNRLRERIADGRVLQLIESFLKAGIMDGLTEWEPEMGAPQGAVLSPLLSNVYLNPLDHLMVSLGHEMVRYADDFVILCRSQAEAEEALTQVRRWCEAEGLTVHPTKTRIADVRTAAFEFLGYRFETTGGRLLRFPRAKSMKKFKDNVRAKTRRTNGNSLPCIIANLNCTLRGWYGYFKHSYWTTFERIDRWVRVRLRSILRKREGRKGRGRGNDNNRWPNAFFAEHGLCELEAAYVLESQPT
jgi:RNA-directed DNA polymerase